MLSLALKPKFAGPKSQVPNSEEYGFRAAKMRDQVSNVDADADAILVDGPDKASFQVIESERPQRHARYKSQMYYRGKIIVGADRDSWTFVNSEYGRDEHDHDADGRRVQGSGFVMLIYNYEKTEKQVFLNGILWKSRTLLLLKSGTVLF